ncbi:MAG TPA: crosslink repair DNA glycosylase YcaQ family protein [Actinophytocola sp.]|uniref:winged helix-turn-helix domain-containing protein n=1 Tax=Actinophytocola sp. TaxID=1872138 RepID=UPI002DDD2FA7|nr:crosslink repair DNA glycosylase YcaQ family protein [Actinophytocola sp.]HEV2784194.1 crosslink repair DNA glycosylase YcaQ family protein [Actinophytocola sp.]
MTETLTAAAARRMALAAQGFADPRPAAAPSHRHLRKVLSRVQLFQLDSVNVAVRAHYMPMFSRLGPYKPSLVDDAAWAHTARRPRLLVEYWAHMASLMPVTDWPLLRWRMRQYEQRFWGYTDQKLAEHARLFADLLTAVKELGPVSAGKLEDELGGSPRRARASGGWWNRSDVKHACEYLFAAGQLTTGARQGFERLYDVPERVLPPEVLTAPPVPDEEAARRLILRAAVAHGVATEPDLRDYYRLKPQRSQPAVAELVDAGLLEPVKVEGWRHPAYRHPDARLPRAITGRALLCPFDPLIWERDRTERIFNFRYRIEIYVPEAKRVHGYYVFPFLLDGELVARVDLKSDRAAGVLRVQSAFAEPTADVPRVAAELAAELRVMADWLRLDKVVVADRGDLAAPLAAAVRA